MDFTLSKMHQLQNQLYREFAQTEIKPLAHEMDEQEQYSMPLLAAMQKQGFLGIPFARRWGGAGADTLSYCLCMEEFAKVDASTAITISVHTSLCCGCINTFGSDTQREKYLRPLVSGQAVGCFSLTEPGAGSDVAAGKTRAVLEGDHYTINGSKVFTTNSGFADTFIVFAITDKTKGARGMSAFVVPRGTPGLSVSPDIPRMGIRAASNAAVTFEDMEVPAENLLGREGDGFKIAMKALDAGRIGIGAQAVGIAQGALDEAIQYVKERKQFGKSIAAFQTTQFKIADMQTNIDAARLLVWRAAKSKDDGENFGTNAAMGKLFASRMAGDVTRECVQLLGGYGYAREYPVERMMRDAKITEIYEGTSEVMKMVIAGSMRIK